MIAFVDLTVRAANNVHLTRFGLTVSMTMCVYNLTELQKLYIYNIKLDCHFLNPVDVPSFQSSLHM